MRHVNDPVLEDHATGDKHCTACTTGFPKPCPECGGLLHASLERIEDDGIVLISECEDCHARPE